MKEESQGSLGLDHVLPPGHGHGKDFGFYSECTPMGRCEQRSNKILLNILKYIFY